MPTPFAWPRSATTAELAALTAGGIDYIRTRGNEVKGLALRLDLNPDAPETIVFGKGPRVEFRAELFLSSGAVVPVFVKRHTNRWEYAGHYRARDLRRDQAAIDRYGACREPGTVAGVLFLERVVAPPSAR